MKTLVAITLGIGLFVLVRRRLIHIDLSFVLFGALIALSFVSISDTFIRGAAELFGILYEPLIVVLLALLILLSLVTLLAVYITRLSQRHVSLLRRVAVLEFEKESARVAKISKPKGVAGV